MADGPARRTRGAGRASCSTSPTTTTSPAAPATSRRSPRTPPRGARSGSGRASWSTSARSTRPATLLGRRLALPVLLAPMAAQRLLHPDGEPGAARAAGAAGTVYCLSTRATADLAEVAAAASGPLWFQLYVDRDRERTERVLARAAEHGFGAVLLTVDLPVGGRRERERRHLDVPFPDGVALASHLGARARAPPHGDRRLGRGAGLGRRRLDPRRQRAAGDRQGASSAPRTPTPRWTPAPTRSSSPTTAAASSTAACRPRSRCARSRRRSAGRVPVLVDGGIRDGADVVRALALGADAVLIGRPYAWGACDRRRGRRARACSTRSPTTCASRSRSRAARRSPPSSPAACASPAGEAAISSANVRQPAADARGRGLHVGNLFRGRPRFRPPFAGCPIRKTVKERKTPSAAS